MNTTTPAAEPIDVIYIAGAGRSGSTIVDRVLGSLENATSYNEISRIWHNGFIENQICSCGLHFDKCPLWSAISKKLRTENENMDLKQIHQLRSRVDQSRFFIKLLMPIKSKKFKRELRAYQQIIGSLYKAIGSIGPTPVIIDSSKLPSSALILSGIPGIKVHVVHLVRDVRACVYAWQKIKDNPGTGGVLDQYSPLRTSIFWIVRNSLSWMLSKRANYCQIRYEDLMANPAMGFQELIGRIKPLAGQRINIGPDRKINLPTLHSIAGNPHRFSPGETRLVEDKVWHLKLKKSTRWMVTLLTWPWLVYYRYWPINRVPVLSSSEFGKGQGPE